MLADGDTRDDDRLHPLLTSKWPMRSIFLGLWQLKSAHPLAPCSLKGLKKIVRERKNYDIACRCALVLMTEGLDLGWSPPRSREELHER